MRSRKKKLWRIYFFSLFFLLIIFFLLGAVINIFLKYQEVESRHNQIVSKIDDEILREEELEEKLKILESKKGQERILIEKNNLKKPGEKVIKILDY